MEYVIRFSTKESVEYREGPARFDFWIGPFLDIPRVEDWDRVMPLPFRGRRNEILERLRADSRLLGTPFRDVLV
ncbi:hypothetical protein [Frondihabitans sp. Leaf304]|uniref:hypothetical protein n=1 Tax=Frondihabitans sp. Leaf304 TaxID=1736329 RepID=UPI0006FCA9F7|nr:hypothetical protein [Frondihabitans sp. Leaf304]KQQ25573.1 hypothetical protein ASF54_14300 [Frondihabitans sp. Leaf304]